MVAAYYLVHLPRSVWPIMNRGERAVLYFGVYLYLAATGAGAFSVDGLIKAGRREKAAR